MTTTPEQSLTYRRSNLVRRDLQKQVESETRGPRSNFGSGIRKETRIGGIPSNLELKIPFRSLAVTTATTQISSLVFCLAWSVKFNFYESTATHCRVANYLPSLSATLDFTPQRDVWRSCIGLSGVPRYLIAYLYYRIIFKSKPLLWLHWIEITALVGLSIVDSIKYFTFHAFCVGVFLLTSIIHMTLVCNDHVQPSKLSSLSETTRRKLEETKIVKKRIAVVNFIAIVAALYLYDRHNRYCEPGVYSAFSLLEYIVIVANIVYHLQAYYDLEEYSFLVARIPEPDGNRVKFSPLSSNEDVGYPRKLDSKNE